MFKPGITRFEQLLAADPKSTRIISARLLLELDRCEDAQRAELRKRIIRGLLLPNTTGKTTWSGRFEKLDAQIAKILLSRFPDSLSCLDVGASDGTTALELFRCLSDHPNLRFLMTDLNEKVFIREGSVFSDAFDDDGTLIQSTVGPFAIPITKISHMHPLQLVNRLLFAITVGLRRKRLEQQWRQSDGGGEAAGFRAVSMLTQEVQSVLASEPRLRFARMNLFDPPADSFDFVRMMNVLNRQSGEFGFPDSDVILGLDAITKLVNEGGSMLIGRMSGGPDGVINATLFSKEAGALVPQQRFGNGSEIEPLLG